MRSRSPWALALRLLPREFRAEHGPELLALIHDRLADAGAMGISQRLFLVLATLGDLLATAARMRLPYAIPVPGRSSLPPPLPEPPSPLANWTPDMLLQDLTFSLRGLLHRPLFGGVIIATLALGIGANTLIYSAVDTVVLNPFDLPEPDRVVAIGTEYPRLGEELGFFEVLSGPEYVDIQRQVTSLDHVVGFDLGNRQIMGADQPQNLFTGFWWADPLPALGLTPLLGRSFLPDDFAQRRAVAMISERVWRSRFAGDASVVGSTISISDDPYVLIGVFPAAVNIYGTDLWTALNFGPEELPRNRRQFNIVARIAEGHTLREVNAELETVARRTEQEYGAEFDEYAGWRLPAFTWTDAQVRTMRPAAMILLAAVGFVLLLVCANVASLLLSRSAARQREMAVRAALGAGRAQIIRQLLSESLLVAVLGASVGLVLAYFGLQWLGANMPSNLLPTTRPLAINDNALAYTSFVTVLAAMLFGLAPALHGARFDLQQALGASASTSGTRSRRRMHDAFVALEVALALVLLTGAGLAVTSLWRLQHLDAGLDTENVLTMRLTLPWSRYEGEAISNFFVELADRVEAIPGVTSAASTAQFPPIGFLRREFSLPDQAVDTEARLPTALLTIASADYMETMRIPLRAGRTFNSEDIPGGRFVAVINEQLARRYFGDDDPVGQRIKLGKPDDAELPMLEVVGVVGDTRNTGLQNPVAPEIYVSLQQANGSFNQLFLVLRTEGEPHSVLPAVRAAVAAIDPDQPVYSIATLEETMASGYALQGFAMMLLATFALVAVVLAATGIFGIAAYSVSQRSREIGLRMALGAGAVQVRRLVVRQALLPVLSGTLVGLALSVAAGVALTGFLSELQSFEPVALATVATTLLAVAVLASYLPARKASRIDPVDALRAE